MSRRTRVLQLPHRGLVRGAGLPAAEGACLSRLHLRGGAPPHFDGSRPEACRVRGWRDSAATARSRALRRLGSRAWSDQRKIVRGAPEDRVWLRCRSMLIAAPRARLLRTGSGGDRGTLV